MGDLERVLVVDDEAKLRRILVRLMREAGYEVADAGTGTEGVALAEEFRPDVVIMDQNLPDLSGQEATERIVSTRPGVKVLMLTAYGAIDRAVEAMRRGAHDYLTKPFDNDELLLRVARAMESRSLAQQVVRLQEALTGQDPFDRIVGASPELQSVLTLARRVARTDVPVLVEGESGTGKELLVRAIHETSDRAAGPLVAVNCAAVPADLVESEFFGHERGAFTGAGRAHQGRFVQADGGTLFLDEITEMPVELQTKLLRALEEGEVTPVGGARAIPVDVRVMAATNRGAQQAVADGQLREDLYHRLAVVSLRMPPLRERRGDIALLARLFLGRASAEVGASRGLSDEALALLEAYQWPGGVRELANAVRSAAVLCDGDVILPDHLPAAVRGDAGAFQGRAATCESMAVAVGAVERQMIEAALAAEDGNKTRAAARLGITRKTLAAKLAQYAMEQAPPPSTAE